MILCVMVLRELRELFYPQTSGQYHLRQRVVISGTRHADIHPVPLLVLTTTRQTFLFHVNSLRV